MTFPTFKRAVKAEVPPRVVVDIYALCEPETGAIRYVGKTTDITRRFAQHVRAQGPSARDRWIGALRRRGAVPRARLLEESDAATWAERERAWIAALRAAGCQLLNVTAGGEPMHRSQPPNAKYTRRARPCAGCGRTMMPTKAQARALATGVQTRAFCAPACYRASLLGGARAGARNGRWDGGRARSRGYVYVRTPSERRSPYVPEHRLAAAAVVGRPVRPDEVVLHRNGDRTDNTPDNLIVLTRRAWSRARQLGRGGRR